MTLAICHVWENMNLSKVQGFVCTIYMEMERHLV